MASLYSINTITDVFRYANFAKYGSLHYRWRVFWHISAKVCKENGLIPFILEKSSSPGGLWKGFPEEIGVWRSLVSVNSKHIEAFSDFLWPLEDPDFPTSQQTCNYLLNYIEKHELSPSIHCSCEVFEVDKSDEDYKVTWKHSGALHSQLFKYVIVATGRYAKENLPFEHTDSYKGTLIKGGFYREPSVFTGKKVACIGKSFTASEISFEALETASSVIQIYKDPYYCIPKLSGQTPHDFFSFGLPSTLNHLKVVLSASERKESKKKLLKIFGNPGQYLPEWEVPESDLASENIRLSIQSAEYYEAVARKRIQCIRGEASDLYENGVILADGSRIEADVIVTGMGYTADYSFLSEGIKEVIRYEGNNKLIPTIMYRSMFHPSLPRFGFVGNAVIAAPGRFELQAEVVFRYFMGTLNLSDDEIEQGIRDDLNVRNNRKELSWPYDFLGFTLECLRTLGVRINFEMLKEEFGYSNGPLLPYFFFMERPGQIDICREAINEIKEKHPEFNFL